MMLWRVARYTSGEREESFRDAASTAVESLPVADTTDPPQAEGDMSKRRDISKRRETNAQASAVSATLFPTKELTFLEVDHIHGLGNIRSLKEVRTTSNIDLSAVFEFIYSENYTSIMSPSMGLSSRLDLNAL